jgi:hypothetical protein
LAYTLGRISPKSRIKKVTKTTSVKNFKETKPNKRYVIDEKNTDPRLLKSKTIPILMALFAINIVANNFLGLSKSFTTRAAFALVSFSSSDKSVDERPKKATSAPEIKAEQQIKKSNTPILMEKKEGSIESK